MKTTLFLCTLLCAQLFGFGQFFDPYIDVELELSQDLGHETQPPLTSYVQDLEDYGTGFGGGIQVGETINDFTIYNPSKGTEVNLRTLIQESDKPVMLTSLSNTCTRVLDSHQEPFGLSFVDWGNYIYSITDLFSLVQVYGFEAHPQDGNCPSNCPTLESVESITGIWNNQPVVYNDRAQMASSVDSALNVMGYDQAYRSTIYIDNHDNRLYNNLFERPYGLIVLDCQGTVIYRVDWAQDVDVNELNEIVESYEGPCVGNTLICTEDEIDTDQDGLCDEFEVYYGLNPYNEDSDGDGFTDGYENDSNFNPLDSCDPLSIDSDEDGFCDAEELFNGSDPNDACSPTFNDQDEDGLCDSMETTLGTDPFSNDSDLDGILDGDEVGMGSDPLNSCDPLGDDSDGDTICDGEEIALGYDNMNPCDPFADDQDQDGLCAGEELGAGSDDNDACDPLSSDVDLDGLCEGLEIAYGTDPLDGDSDQDGVNDGDELEWGSDPLDPDSFPTSVDDEESLKMMLFPSPTSEYLFFKGKDLQSLSMVNLNGQMVLQLENPNKKIDVSQLNEGLYFVTVETVDGFQKTEKILIKR